MADVESPRRLAGRTGAIEIVELSRRDDLNDSKNLDAMRAAWVANRFGLPRPVAALVAGLALGDVHG